MSNTATHDGGGIYARVRPRSIDGANIAGNQGGALEGGGGLYVDRGSVTLRQAEFALNEAGTGAGMLTKNALVAGANLTYTENAALLSGGAAAVSADVAGSVFMTDVLMSGNSASIGHGGGVYAYQTPISLHRATIAHNFGSPTRRGRVRYRHTHV